MNMPQGYEQAQVQGERELPELGGHHMIIKNVKVSETKTGKKMIVVSFDFASNDRQPEFFMKAFKADTREDKKWPRRGTQYIVVTGNDGLTSRGYKTFCTCYENSNGTKVKWVEDDEAWCAQFKNKKIGGAFGIVHGLWDSPEGLVETKNPELRWFVSEDKVDPNNIPKEKDLSADDKARLNTANGNGNDMAAMFTNIPAGTDEEIPF